MKKVILFLFCAVFCLGAFSQAKAQDIAYGSLIKASLPAVYYYAQDGKRYVFPNEKTYKTWYDDFSDVKTITDAELASIRIGGNVVYRAGVKLVKITTDPKVYAVAKDGVLRWVKTEAIAKDIYGNDWASQVEDIPDAFFVNYAIGTDIESAEDFDKDAQKASDQKPIEEGVLPTEQPKKPAVSYKWDAKEIETDPYLHNDLQFEDFNGGFVAVWNDDRHGQKEILYQKASEAMVATGDIQRVSNNIRTSNGGVADFNGQNLYVMWEDSGLLKRAIYWKKYDSVGNEINDALFASSTFATSQYPDLAWNSELGFHGVVWWDTKTSTDPLRGKIIFKRFNNDLKEGPDLRLGEETQDAYPKIVQAKENFGVIWQEETNKIKFALVDYASNIVGEIKEIYTAQNAVRPQIASSGEIFGVVWEDAEKIYFALLDDSGTLASPVKEIADGTEPDVIWTGDKFYVSYTNGLDINLAKLSKLGSVDQVGINISDSSAESSGSSLAVNEGLVGIAWLEKDGDVNKIMGATEEQE